MTNQFDRGLVKAKLAGINVACGKKKIDWLGMFNLKIPS